MTIQPHQSLRKQQCLFEFKHQQLQILFVETAMAEKEQRKNNNCDRACENRACGHKLHPITLQVISQYWKRIFPFCNLHYDAN